MSLHAATGATPSFSLITSSPTWLDLLGRVCFRFTVNGRFAASLARMDIEAVKDFPTWYESGFDPSLCPRFRMMRRHGDIKRM